LKHVAPVATELAHTVAPSAELLLAPAALPNTAGSSGGGGGTVAQADTPEYRPATAAAESAGVR
jgi:hypothetical protein